MTLIIIIDDVKINSSNITNYLWKLLFNEECSILVTFVISDIHSDTVFIVINYLPDLENYIV